MVTAEMKRSFAATMRMCGNVHIEATTGTFNLNFFSQLYFFKAPSN